MCDGQTEQGLIILAGVEHDAAIIRAKHETCEQDDDLGEETSGGTRVHDRSPSQCCSWATASSTGPAMTSASLAAICCSGWVCWGAVSFAAEHLRRGGDQMDGWVLVGSVRGCRYCSTGLCPR